MAHAKKGSGRSKRRQPRKGFPFRKKGSGRSKRRQPRKGFPFRVVAYLDSESKNLLEDALTITGENASMFIAKALAERARKVLKIK